MKENLSRLPFKVKDYKEKLGINNVPLAKWFRENVGNSSFSKHIPLEFKQLCKEQLEILWESMCLGDGNKTSSSYAYSTSSRELAGDIQEILLKMGDCGDINTKRTVKDHYCKDRLVKASSYKDNFIVHRDKHIGETQNRSSLNNSKSRKLYIEEWIDYSGPIFCLRVPNETVYTRRNGKVAWSFRSDKEDRKSHGRMMKAMRYFLDSNPDVKEQDIVWLYHSTASDPRGMPLSSICHKFRLDNVIKFMDPSIADTMIPEENLATLMNTFDVHLLCSKREGFGMPILETMSCGVSNICHDFSSMPELVKGHGWLCKSLGYDLNLETTPINAETASPDVYDIARCIKDAYFDEKKRTTYGRKSREFALKYTWDDLIRYQWVPFLENIQEDLRGKSIEERRIL